jgi:hypothetical protein
MSLTTAPTLSAVTGVCRKVFRRRQAPLLATQRGHDLEGCVRREVQGVTKSLDLNEDNHCAPYPGSVEVYETYAEKYRKELQREHAQLQDAITGTFLSTNDRPIYLSQAQQGDCCHQVTLVCREANAPLLGKYWLLNEWGLMNNVTIEVAWYCDWDNVSGTLSVEGEVIWKVELRQTVPPNCS